MNLACILQTQSYLKTKTVKQNNQRHNGTELKFISYNITTKQFTLNTQ